MVVLNFTLTPEAASKIHDLLVCLGKFSEIVAIEARPERVGGLELQYLQLRSHDVLLSSLSPPSIHPNQHTAPSPSTASSFSANMNAFRTTVAQTDASRAACTQKRCSLSSKGGFTIP